LTDYDPAKQVATTATKKAALAVNAINNIKVSNQCKRKTRVWPQL
jgi:hypothetical protein